MITVNWTTAAWPQPVAPPPRPHALDYLAGEQLLGVLFTPQQIELQFVIHKVVVYADLAVQSAQGSSVTRAGVAGWRADLCGRMGHVLRRIEVERDEILIEFDDQAALCVSTHKRMPGSGTSLQIWRGTELVQSF